MKKSVFPTKNDVNILETKSISDYKIPQKRKRSSFLSQILLKLRREDVV
ncbi:hypothetical protein [Chryseobacterium aquaeductus]|nr:hypothetical protein [Chryseobacterium aquaeductus]